MNKNLFALYFCMCWSSGFSQAVLNKIWDRRFGGNHDEWIAGMQQTFDKGYIMGGTSFSWITGNKTQNNRDNTLSTGDYWVIKFNEQGTPQWNKRFGGNTYDILTAIERTSDGGYILGGYSDSDNNGDKTEINRNFGTSDYWIVKIDSVGNKQWDKTFGGGDDDELTALHQTPDGGYILGGGSKSEMGWDKTELKWGNAGSWDWWIVKTDSAGNKQWDKRYGGTESDYLNSLQITSDGGYVLGGNSMSGISGDKTQASQGIHDYWVVKIDSAGNKQWDKRYGGSRSDDCFSVQQTYDGGYVLAGLSNSGISGDKTDVALGPGFYDSDYWILKIDSAGNKQWDRTFGGLADEDDFGNIIQTYDGGYMVAGTSYANTGGSKSENNLGSEQVWIIKMDSLGYPQWDKTILAHGHHEVGFVIQTLDGCYVALTSDNGGVGGYKTQTSWSNSYDYWAVKLCDPAQQTYSFMAKANGNNTCSGSCNGSASVLPLYGMAPYQYEWQPGNYSTAEVHNLCAGVYSVKVTDATGSMAFDTLIVSASSPIVNITSGPTLICSNDSTLICATSGFLNYTWNNGQDTACIYTALAGNYYVTATDNNGCSAESNHLTIQVYPVSPVTISVNGDTLSVYNAVTQQWYLNDNPIIGATSNIYVVSQSGSYEVAVTDTNGCVAVSNAIAFSGISPLHVSNSQFTITNPAASYLKIKIDETLFGAQLNIYSATGALVKTIAAIHESSQLINIDNLPSGVYIAEVKMKDAVQKIKWIKM